MYNSHNMTNNLEDFIKGSIIGYITGDALGSPYNTNKIPDDILSVSMVYPSFDDHKLTGSYSEESSLMLCTLSSINEYQSFDIEDIMNRYQQMYIGGYFVCNDELFSLSPSVSESINNYSEGIPVENCSIYDDVSCNDTQCLSRILPFSINNPKYHKPLFCLFHPK